MKNRKILSAVITAAILAGSVIPSYTVFAESDGGSAVTQAELSKVPTGYNGLALAKISDNVYGVTMSEAQLKALTFSPANASITRDDGYHAGFHVDALDAGQGASSISYKRATKFLTDVNASTITGITDMGAGSSTDGQFWIGFKKSWIDSARTNGKPYIAYVIEATYGADKVYYYIALNSNELSEDFTFDAATCTLTHGTETACAVCGNKMYAITAETGLTGGSVSVSPTTALPGATITVTATHANDYVVDDITAEDADGNAIDVTSENGVGTFTMPAKAVTVSATFKLTAQEITLNEETLELTAGETAELTATVKPAGVTDEVVWTSSDATVATVADGVVTAVAAGNATIKATCGDVEAECAVTVTAATNPVTKIELSAETATVVEKEKLAAPTVTYTAKDTTKDTTDEKTVTWSTSDATIAAVDAATGEVTGVKAGEATITATFSETIKASYTVTVTATAVAVESVSLDKTTAELKVGETADLTATVLPATATDKTVTWTSSDDKVATVADGKVTAVAAGEATITVTTKDGDKTATCKVTVTEEKTEVTVKLNKETLTLLKDGSETLTATTTPADAEVTWSSSDTTVATVAGGKITGVKRGTATVTATVKDGDKDVTATCKVTVNEEQALTVPETPSAPAQSFKDEAAEEGKYNESDVFVITKEEAAAAKSVTITVTTKSGKTYTQDVTECYKTVTHTKKDGTTDTLSAGDNFMLAVTVTGIPDDDEVTVTVTVNK